MNTPLLEVRDVKQSFRVGFWLKRAEILHGISFALKPGSICGLLGPNGAGKTTLIHVICGIKPARSGQALIRGRSSAALEARSKVGYLPERPYFHDFLKGRDFLRYLGTLSGLSGKDLESRIDDATKQVGIHHALDVELKRYSKGMLQRIGIAQTMIHDPDLLVLDEPMSGLDPVGRREIRELIQKLAAQGKTVLFSTHMIPDVEKICDQIAIVKKGRLAGFGTIAELMTGKQSLEDYFINEST